MCSGALVSGWLVDKRPGGIRSPMLTTRIGSLKSVRAQGSSNHNTTPLAMSNSSRLIEPQHHPSSYEYGDLKPMGFREPLHQSRGICILRTSSPPSSEHDGGSQADMPPSRWQQTQPHCCEKWQLEPKWLRNALRIKARGSLSIETKRPMQTSAKTSTDFNQNHVFYRMRSKSEKILSWTVAPFQVCVRRPSNYGGPSNVSDIALWGSRVGGR